MKNFNILYQKYTAALAVTFVALMVLISFSPLQAAKPSYGDLSEESSKETIGSVTPNILPNNEEEDCTEEEESSCEDVYSGNNSLLVLGCEPISSLPCDSIELPLPISLSFDENGGGLSDRDSDGTGFTMVVSPSVYTYPPTPTNSSLPGLESSYLDVDAGSLFLTTTKGTAFRSPSSVAGSNNQVNMLGTGFQVPGSVFNIRTQIAQPNFVGSAGDNGQEAGVWYGIDEDNYIKLVTRKSNGNGQRVRLTIETTNPTDPSRVEFTELASRLLNATNPSTVELRLEIDPVYRSIKGFYSFDGGEETAIVEDLLDSLALPQVLATGFDHDSDSGTPDLLYAGITGTHSAAAIADSLLLEFKSFDVEVEPFVPTLIFDQQELGFSIVEGDTAEAQFVNLFTNNSTEPNITFSDAPNSGEWLILPDTAAVGTLRFAVVPDLPVGRYSTTITASSTEFVSAEVDISLVVSSPNSIPRVIRSTPSNGEINVSLSTSVSANDLFFPNGLNGIFGVENSTITNETVKLYKVSNNLVIPATVNGTGGGDGINLTPTIPLEINTEYRFEIDGVKDLTGVAFEYFTATFTTANDNTNAGSALDNVSFTNAGNVATEGMYSSLTIGPDGKFYGLQLSGIVDRWEIASDGRLIEKESFSTLPDVYGSRTAIGFAFEPSSTAGDLRVFVSHAEGVLNNGNAWDGKISRLSGANLENETLVVDRLPRSRRDHLTNGITFRKGEGSVLYFNQGSNTAGGAPDNSWGNRLERLLTAATLRLDLSLLPEADWPLDAKTTMNQAAINAVDVNSPVLGSGSGTYRENNQDFPDDGTYNPFYVDAPLTIFATGIRNAYDLVWHSNGQLYVPNNGTAGGSNTPASVSGTRRIDGVIYDHNDVARRYPPVPATFANNTQRDFLFRVDPEEPTGYYGHPNPLRGEFVLNRGPVDARNYPNSVGPDINFQGIAFDFQFNKSPNGVIEYQSNAEGGNLSGALLVCRYSGGSDIIALIPNGPNGDILTSKIGIPGFQGLGDPLDITEDTRTGNLYVSDLSRQTIVLLKPSAQAAPEPVVEIVPEEITTEDIIGFGPGERITAFVINRGNAPLVSPSARITGPDSTSFTLDVTNVPDVLDPNSSTSVIIRFDPTTVGPKFGKLIVTGVSGAEGSIDLNGLGVAGYTEELEPSLQQILDVYSLNIDVADQDPITSKLDISGEATLTDLIGDEIFGQTFQRATPEPVTVEVLGVFAPETLNPITGFGWYQAGVRNAASELFTLQNAVVRNGQTLNPSTTGVLSFDPGFDAFGFFSRWPVYNDRYVYSEDSLNNFAESLAHHARVYEVPNQDNTYVVAFEGNIENPEYQDIVLLVRNVEPIPETQRPEIVVEPEVVYMEGRFNNTGHYLDTAEVSVLNTGTMPLEIRGVSFGGEFPELMTLYTGPDSTDIEPGGIQTYQIIFNTPRSYVGEGAYHPSTMIFQTNTEVGTYVLPISAMRKRGLGGGNEPPLQLVVQTLRMGIDVGWTTISSDTSTVLKGDEVLIDAFVAAGPGPITIEPVARYSPIEFIPFGWYVEDADTIVTNQVGVLSDLAVESQKLFPALAEGTTSFNYQGEPFGVYISSEVFNHTIYTRDDLNTGIVERRARIYPVKDVNGALVPFKYLVAFEDATNGDYQDYVFTIDNVKEFEAPSPALAFSNQRLNAVVTVGESFVSSDIFVSTNQPDVNETGVVVALSTNASWISLPDSVLTGTPITISLNTFGLPSGVHVAEVISSSDNFASDTLIVTLSINEGIGGTIRVNFQDNSFSPPTNYFADYGEAYGARLGGYTYGWTDAFTDTPSNNFDGASGSGFGVTNSSTDEAKLLNSLNRFNTPGYFLPHNWELKLRNGLWAIRLAVGNPLPNGESQSIYAEGELLVDEFTPAPGSLLQIGVDTVRILDGKLTLRDGNVALDGKTNILFLEAEPVDSSGFSPEILAEVIGNESPSGTYYGDVSVQLEAFDRSGSGRIAAIRYRVNGSSYTLYNEPVQLPASGNAIVEYLVEYDATDLFGNTGYGQTLVRVEPATGAVVRLENLIKMPGTDISFPADDWYSFNIILGPNDQNGDTTFQHRESTMRIHNDGTGTLLITELGTTGTRDFVLDHINIPVGGISIAPNNFIDVGIRNVTTGGEQRIVQQNLVIRSNADNANDVTATFSSLIQKRPEGTNEFDPDEIFSNFGYTTKLGRRSNGQVEYMDSDRPTFEMIDSGLFGDAIDTELFEQADRSKPIYGMRISAFHGPGGATTRFIREDNGFNGGLEWGHTRDQHQTVFPKTNTGAITGKSIKLVPHPFKAEVAEYRSTGGNEDQEFEDEISGIRMYRVLDRDGNNVPNAYFIIQDYINDGCGSGSGNCDFNDNVDIIFNARPLGVPQALGIADKTVDILNHYEDNLSTKFSKGYAGNKLTYSSELITGEATPYWIQLDQNTGILMLDPPYEVADSSFEIVITTVDYNLLVVKDTFNLIVNPTLIDCTVDANVSDAEFSVDCANSTVALDGFTSSGDYYWEGPGGFTSTEANPLVSLPGKYTLFDTVALNNCPLSNSVTVLQGKSAPEVNIVAPNRTLDCTIDSLFLTATSDDPQATFTWFDAFGNFIASGNSLVVRQAADYIVEATNIVGCTVSDTITISVDLSPQFAGNDGSLSLCSADAPLNLYNYLASLGGQPYRNGVWTLNGNVVLELLVPNTAASGDYVYVVGSADGCSTDTAHVLVSIEQANVYYADRDFDGLGDPRSALMACSQPAGYVVDNSDNCPNNGSLNIADFDNDGIGDLCDLDDDNDGTPDGVDCDPYDSSIGRAIPYYADFDRDGLGDINTRLLVCGAPPLDYVLNSRDNCPSTPNPNQTDIDGDGIGDLCDPSPNGATSFWLEAECAVVGSDWRIETDSLASGEQYATFRGTRSLEIPSDVPSNRVRFTVSKVQPGDYYLFARVQATASSNDSYWVRINGGVWFARNALLRSSFFKWNDVAVGSFKLADGVNTIDFAYREPVAKLDKIYITTSSTIPSGLGGPGQNCAGADNKPPIAVASGSPLVGFAPLTVQLSGRSSIDLDPDGTIVNYGWTWETGAVVGDSVSVVLSDTGWYNVVLTVTDDAGDRGTDTLRVRANKPPNVAPSAFASVNPRYGIAPLITTLDGSQSRDSDGTIESYQWSWNGGSNTGQTVPDTFELGSYNVTLVVTDNEDAKDSIVTQVLALEANADEDNDGLSNDVDNCPTVFNPDQALPVFYADLDRDGLGDPGDSVIACEAPLFFVANNLDLCPTVTSTNNNDTDGDGIGNVCDEDDDNDGVLDADDCNPLDAGIGLPIAFYADVDGDGIGNFNDTIVSCSPPTGYVAIFGDNCPFAYNPDQQDFDGDGIGDVCDAVGNSQTSFWMEAECAIVGSQWEFDADNTASNEEFIVYTGSRSLTVPAEDPANRVRFEIFNVKAGNYNLFARASSRGTASDSYWIRVNDGDWFVLNKIASIRSFVWNEVSEDSFTLGDGYNTVDVSFREADAKLDKLYLTTESDIPTSIGVEADNCETGGSNQPPVAVAQASVIVGPAPLTVDFDGRFSFDANPTGFIVDYNWTWAEGSATGDSARFEFTLPGYYDVVLQVTDNSGDTATDTVKIFAQGPPNPFPTARATASPSRGATPLISTLDASASSDPNGTIVTYEWSWNGGGSASGVMVTDTFQTGFYDVTLTVTDDEGAQNSTIISVNALDPSADTDADGIKDFQDNCPTIANANQIVPTFYFDADRDGLGDPLDSIVACERPIGYVTDKTDNCPTIANSNVLDTDGDGIGNICDDDDDNDGVLDLDDCAPLNNTIGAARTFYADVDGDGYGDINIDTISCSKPSGYSLLSGDNCPSIANPDQLDSDADGEGDSCDASPFGQTSFWLEAECAEIGSDWTLVDDTTVSNNQYVTYNGERSIDLPADVPETRIHFTVDNVQEGVYRLFARISGRGSSNDSYWVRINDGTWFVRNNLNAVGDFVWDDLAEMDIDLPDGINTIDIAYRESQVKLDKIYLAQGGTSPTTLGPEGQGCPPPPNTAPVAIAEVSPISGFAPLTVNLDGRQSFDTDGTILSYNWNWMVDSISGDSVQVVFDTPGSYTIVLKVTDDADGTGRDTVLVTVMEVPNSKPTAVATANPSSGNAPLITTLDASGSSDSDGTIVAYDWSWTGDSATGVMVTDTFTSGFYDITLVVTDDDGARDTTVISVDAINPNADSDTDGVNDDVDNCPTVFNPTQMIPTFYADYDGDGLGDPLDSIIACEAPEFFVSDNTDNCPALASIDNTDTDGDGLGDACDDDDDNDGIPDVDDCDPLVDTIGPARTFYVDVDGDGFGDISIDTIACVQPAGYAAVAGDNCLTIANADQADSDSDGLGDVCDASPNGMTSFWLEAECAEVGASWRTVADTNASNDSYVVYYGTRSTSTPPADIAANRIRFVVDNVQAGTYRLFGRVSASGSTSDSYWVRINGGAWFYRNKFTATNSFVWNDVVESSFDLTDGTTTIDFAFREEGAKLDKLYLSSTEGMPTLVGSEGDNCAPPPNQLPVAVATASPTEGFAPLTVDFNGRSSSDIDGTIVTYNWSWSVWAAMGDSTQLTFIDPGTYDVVLRVTDDRGGIGMDTVQIIVNAVPNEAPVAVATASPSSGNAPLITTLDASGSSDSDGTIVAYDWSWTGGNATGVTVLDTFATGFYDITLVVTDDDGATDTTVISVDAINPNADTDSDGVNDNLDNCPTVFNPDQMIPTFYADYDGDGLGDPLTSIVACEAPEFFVSDSTDNCPEFASIDTTDTDGDGLGDACDDDDDNDGVLDIDDCDPLVDTIGMAGTYYADVDGDGFGDSTMDTTACVPPAGYVAVSGDNCVAIANPDQTDSDDDGFGDVCDASPNGMTSFWLEAECAEVGASWQTVVDTNASNDSYVVYYGTRSTSTPPADLAANRIRFVVDNVQAGTYRLFGRVSASGSTSDSYWVRINGGAWFYRNKFTSTNSFVWNDVVESSFALGDGTTTIDFAFREEGAKLDKLFLSSTDGMPTIVGSEGDNCAPPPNLVPVAVATASPTEGFAPLTVDFYGRSSSDADGTIVAYDWSWSVWAATGDSTQLTFIDPGTYDVVLQVTDDQGGIGMDTVQIIVNAVPNEAPVAIATASPSSGNAPLISTLDASGSSDSDGTIVAYDWSWAGGNATGVTVLDTFATGFYDITLVVTDNDGAMDTTVISVDAINPNADTDTDGVNDNLDNCPTVFNPDQTIPTFYADYDGDGLGDPLDSIVACEAPEFFVDDNTDNCPVFASLDITDTDGDGQGDACDNDDDNDGVLDIDDCDPLVDTIGAAGTYYADIDGDGFGDSTMDTTACVQPAGYVAVSGDNCVMIANPDQTDSDSDGLGDVCDASPNGMTSFRLEAECAEVGTQWQTVSDLTASNDSYVVYLGARSTSAPPADLPENQVRFIVDNVQAGNYNLYGLASARGSTSDSYWIRIDEGPWFIKNKLTDSNAFVWNDLVGAGFALGDGTSIIDIAFREPEAKLDKLHLTIVSGLPGVVGPEGDNCGPVSSLADDDDNSFIKEIDSDTGAAETTMTIENDSKEQISYPTVRKDYPVPGSLGKPSVEMNVYPNPVIDQVNVRLKSDFIGRCTIVVSDLSGRRIIEKQIDKDSDVLFSKLDARDLPAGTYLIQFISGDQYQQQLFVKGQ